MEIENEKGEWESECWLDGEDRVQGLRANEQPSQRRAESGLNCLDCTICNFFENFRKFFQDCIVREMDVRTVS